MFGKEDIYKTHNFHSVRMCRLHYIYDDELSCDEGDFVGSAQIAALKEPIHQILCLR